MFSNAMTLFRIAGFAVRVDPSWFLIAGLITWSLAVQYLPGVLPDQTGTTYTIMALIGMLGFFASLVVHELSHALVARRHGVEMRTITLFLFGGVAEMTDDVPSPKAEFEIAIAGPVASLAIAALFGTVTQLTPPGPAHEVLFYLSFINAILAVFNLLPAFPMDGGRILRAWLWQQSGDLLAATRRAASWGNFFGLALVALGFVEILSGQGVGGFWFVLIGGFVMIAARSGYQQVLTKAAFQDKTVAALLTKPAVVVDPGQTLTALVNDIFLSRRISFAPVVEDGTLLGHIDTGVLASIDRENWDNTQVGDVFVDLAKTPVVPPDLPVTDLMARISETGQRKFVVAKTSDLIGVITLTDLIRFLTLSQSLMTQGKPNDLHGGRAS